MLPFFMWRCWVLGPVSGPSSTSGQAPSFQSKPFHNSFDGCSMWVFFSFLDDWTTGFQPRFVELWLSFFGVPFEERERRSLFLKYPIFVWGGSRITMQNSMLISKWFATKRGESFVVVVHDSLLWGIRKISDSYILAANWFGEKRCYSRYQN